jgi:hypothetical protein
MPCTQSGSLAATWPTVGTSACGPAAGSRPRRWVSDRRVRSSRRDGRDPSDPTRSPPSRPASPSSRDWPLIDAIENALGLLERDPHAGHELRGRLRGPRSLRVWQLPRRLPAHRRRADRARGRRSTWLDRLPHWGEISLLPPGVFRPPGPPGLRWRQNDEPRYQQGSQRAADGIRTHDLLHGKQTL